MSRVDTMYTILNHISKNYRDYLIKNDFKGLYDEIFKGGDRNTVVRIGKTPVDVYNFINALFLILLKPAKLPTNIFLSLVSFLESKNIKSFYLDPKLIKDILKKDTITLPLTEYFFSALIFNWDSSAKINVYLNVDNNLKKSFIDFCNFASNLGGQYINIWLVFPDTYNFEECVDFMGIYNNVFNANIKMSVKCKEENGELYLPFDIKCLPDQEKQIDKILEVRV